METYLGPLNVNYRETPTKQTEQTIVWNSTINERHATISITLSIEPVLREDNSVQSFSEIELIRTDEQNFEQLRKDHVGKESSLIFQLDFLGISFL